MMRVPATLKRVREACSQAARNYRAKPYEGPIVLFRANEKGLSSVNQESVWKCLAPQIEIYEVSGHHGNIVDEPQVQLLAGELKARLETAFRKHGEEQGLQSVTLAVADRPEGQLEIA
jgi:thioesterase domain-containing protein